jgi:protocatechuate 3,4-dioxygenase beta subunit
MNRRLFLSTRREMLRSAAFGAATLWTPGLFAEALSLTPSQTEGPFYPNHLPLDTDNDLLLINDAITPAVGEVTHLSGRILSQAGEPIRNAVVEIWEADSGGNYIHTRSRSPNERDGNFQGFGRFLTGSSGEYYFRTIKPGPYGSRTPHIHFAIYRGDRRVLTTQMYIKGHPQNGRDGIFSSLNQTEAELCMADFKPLPGSSTGELVANWDVIIGATPEDPSLRLSSTKRSQAHHGSEYTVSCAGWFRHVIRRACQLYRIRSSHSKSRGGPTIDWPRRAGAIWWTFDRRRI